MESNYDLSLRLPTKTRPVVMPDLISNPLDTFDSTAAPEEFAPVDTTPTQAPPPPAPPAAMFISQEDTRAFIQELVGRDVTVPDAFIPAIVGGMRQLVGNDTNDNSPAQITSQVRDRINSNDCLKDFFRRYAMNILRYIDGIPIPRSAAPIDEGVLAATNFAILGPLEQPIWQALHQHNYIDAAGHVTASFPGTITGEALGLPNLTTRQAVQVTRILVQARDGQVREQLTDIAARSLADSNLPDFLLDYFRRGLIKFSFRVTTNRQGEVDSFRVFMQVGRDKEEIVTYRNRHITHQSDSPLAHALISYLQTIMLGGPANRNTIDQPGVFTRNTLLALYNFLQQENLISLSLDTNPAAGHTGLPQILRQRMTEADDAFSRFQAAPIIDISVLDQGLSSLEESLEVARRNSRDSGEGEGERAINRADTRHGANLQRLYPGHSNVTAYFRSQVHDARERNQLANAALRNALTVIQFASQYADMDETQANLAESDVSFIRHCREAVQRYRQVAAQLFGQIFSAGIVTENNFSPTTLAQLREHGIIDRNGTILIDLTSVTEADLHLDSTIDAAAVLATLHQVQNHSNLLRLDTRAYVHALQTYRRANELSLHSQHTHDRDPDDTYRKASEALDHFWEQAQRLMAVLRSWQGIAQYNPTLYQTIRTNIQAITNRIRQEFNQAFPEGPGVLGQSSFSFLGERASAVYQDLQTHGFISATGQVTQEIDSDPDLHLWESLSATEREQVATLLRNALQLGNHQQLLMSIDQDVITEIEGARQMEALDPTQIQERFTLCGDVSQALGDGAARGVVLDFIRNMLRERQLSEMQSLFQTFQTFSHNPLFEQWVANLYNNNTLEPYGIHAPPFSSDLSQFITENSRLSDASAQTRNRVLNLGVVLYSLMVQHNINLAANDPHRLDFSQLVDRAQQVFTVLERIPNEAQVNGVLRLVSETSDDQQTAAYELAQRSDSYLNQYLNRDDRRLRGGNEIPLTARAIHLLESRYVQTSALHGLVSGRDLRHGQVTGPRGTTVTPPANAGDNQLFFVSIHGVYPVDANVGSNLPRADVSHLSGRRYRRDPMDFIRDERLATLKLSIARLVPVSDHDLLIGEIKNADGTITRVEPQVTSRLTNVDLDGLNKVFAEGTAWIFRPGSFQLVETQRRVMAAMANAIEHNDNFLEDTIVNMLSDARISELELGTNAENELRARLARALRKAVSGQSDLRFTDEERTLLEVFCRSLPSSDSAIQTLINDNFSHLSVYERQYLRDGLRQLRRGVNSFQQKHGLNAEQQQSLYQLSHYLSWAESLPAGSQQRRNLAIYDSRLTSTEPCPALIEALQAAATARDETFNVAEFRRVYAAGITTLRYLHRTLAILASKYPPEEPGWEGVGQLAEHYFTQTLRRASMQAVQSPGQSDTTMAGLPNDMVFTINVLLYDRDDTPEGYNIVQELRNLNIRSQQLREQLRISLEAVAENYENYEARRILHQTNFNGFGADQAALLWRLLNNSEHGWIDENGRVRNNFNERITKDDLLALEGLSEADRAAINHLTAANLDRVSAILREAQGNPLIQAIAECSSLVNNVRPGDPRTSQGRFNALRTRLRQILMTTPAGQHADPLALSQTDRNRSYVTNFLQLLDQLAGSAEDPTNSFVTNATSFLESATMLQQQLTSARLAESDEYTYDEHNPGHARDRQVLDLMTEPLNAIISTMQNLVRIRSEQLPLFDERTQGEIRRQEIMDVLGSDRFDQAKWQLLQRVFPDLLTTPTYTDRALDWLGGVFRGDDFHVSGPEGYTRQTVQQVLNHYFAGNPDGSFNLSSLIPQVGDSAESMNAQIALSRFFERLPRSQYVDLLSTVPVMTLGWTGATGHLFSLARDVPAIGSAVLGPGHPLDLEFGADSYQETQDIANNPWQRLGYDFLSFLSLSSNENQRTNMSSQVYMLLAQSQRENVRQVMSDTLGQGSNNTNIPLNRLNHRVMEAFIEYIRFDLLPQMRSPRLMERIAYLQATHRIPLGLEALTAFENEAAGRAFLRRLDQATNNNSFRLYDSYHTHGPLYEASALLETVLRIVGEINQTRSVENPDIYSLTYFDPISEIQANGARYQTAENVDIPQQISVIRYDETPVEGEITDGLPLEAMLRHDVPDWLNLYGPEIVDGTINQFRDDWATFSLDALRGGAGFATHLLTFMGRQIEMGFTNTWRGLTDLSLSLNAMQNATSESERLEARHRAIQALQHAANGIGQTTGSFTVFEVIPWIFFTDVLNQIENGNYAQAFGSAISIFLTTWRSMMTTGELLVTMARGAQTAGSAIPVRFNPDTHTIEILDSEETRALYEARMQEFRPRLEALGHRTGLRLMYYHINPFAILQDAYGGLGGYVGRVGNAASYMAGRQQFSVTEAPSQLVLEEAAPPSTRSGSWITVSRLQAIEGQDWLRRSFRSLTRSWSGIPRAMVDLFARRTPGNIFFNGQQLSPDLFSVDNLQALHSLTPDSHVNIRFSRIAQTPQGLGQEEVTATVRLGDLSEGHFPLGANPSTIRLVFAEGEVPIALIPAAFQSLTDLQAIWEHPGIRYHIRIGENPNSPPLEIDAETYRTLVEARARGNYTQFSRIVSGLNNSGGRPLAETSIRQFYEFFSPQANIYLANQAALDRIRPVRPEPFQPIEFLQQVRAGNSRYLGNRYTLSYEEIDPATQQRVTRTTSLSGREILEILYNRFGMSSGRPLIGQAVDNQIIEIFMRNVNPMDLQLMVKRAGRGVILGGNEVRSVVLGRFRRGGHLYVDLALNERWFVRQGNFQRAQRFSAWANELFGRFRFSNPAYRGWRDVFFELRRPELAARVRRYASSHGVNMAEARVALARQIYIEYTTQRTASFMNTMDQILNDPERLETLRARESQARSPREARRIRAERVRFERLRAEFNQTRTLRRGLFFGRDFQWLINRNRAAFNTALDTFENEFFETTEHPARPTANSPRAERAAEETETERPAEERETERPPEKNRSRLERQINGVLEREAIAFDVREAGPAVPRFDRAQNNRQRLYERAAGDLRVIGLPDGSGSITTDGRTRPAYTAEEARALINYVRELNTTENYRAGRAVVIVRHGADFSHYTIDLPEGAEIERTIEGHFRIYDSQTGESIRRYRLANDTSLVEINLNFSEANLRSRLGNNETAIRRILAARTQSQSMTDRFMVEQARQIGESVGLSPERLAALSTQADVEALLQEGAARLGENFANRFARWSRTAEGQRVLNTPEGEAFLDMLASPELSSSRATLQTGMNFLGGLVALIGLEHLMDIVGVEDARVRFTLLIFGVHFSNVGLGAASRLIVDPRASRNLAEDLARLRANTAEFASARGLGSGSTSRVIGRWLGREIGRAFIGAFAARAQTGAYQGLMAALGVPRSHWLRGERMSLAVLLAPQGASLTLRLLAPNLYRSLAARLAGRTLAGRTLALLNWPLAIIGAYLLALDAIEIFAIDPEHRNLYAQTEEMMNDNPGSGEADLDAAERFFLGAGFSRGWFRGFDNRMFGFDRASQDRWDMLYQLCLRQTVENANETWDVVRTTALAHLTQAEAARAREPQDLLYYQRVSVADFDVDGLHQEYFSRIEFPGNWAEAKNDLQNIFTSGNLDLGHWEMRDQVVRGPDFAPLGHDQVRVWVVEEQIQITPEEIHSQQLAQYLRSRYDMSEQQVGEFIERFQRAQFQRQTAFVQGVQPNDSDIEHISRVEAETDPYDLDAEEAPAEEAPAEDDASESEGPLSQEPKDLVTAPDSVPVENWQQTSHRVTGYFNEDGVALDDASFRRFVDHEVLGGLTENRAEILRSRRTERLSYLCMLASTHNGTVPTDQFTEVDVTLNFVNAAGEIQTSSPDYQNMLEIAREGWLSEFEELEPATRQQRIAVTRLQYILSGRMDIIAEQLRTYGDNPDNWSNDQNYVSHLESLIEEYYTLTDQLASSSQVRQVHIMGQIADLLGEVLEDYQL